MQGNRRCAPAGAMHLAGVQVEGPRGPPGPAASPVRPCQGAADPSLEAEADKQGPLASCHHPAMQIALAWWLQRTVNVTEAAFPH